MEDGEITTGLLVDLTEELPPKPKTASIEEQLRQMDLTIEKRRATVRSRSAQPESPTNFDDIPLIQDEEFDFDIPCMSSSSDSVEDKENADDDDEEVFFGKVGLTEKCVAKVVQSDEETLKTDVVESTPLSAAELAEVFVEAQKVACYISQHSGKKKKPRDGLSAIQTRLFPSGEDQDIASPPLNPRKRKGTFTLDDDECFSPKRKGHERKGTFTLDSPEKQSETTNDNVSELTVPTVDMQPGSTSKLQRKSLNAPSGKFGLVKSAVRAPGPLKALPTPADSETSETRDTKESNKRLSEGIPQSSRPSKLQRNAPQRRSLRAPSGRFGASSAGVRAPGPLKALPTPAVDPETSDTRDTKEAPKILSGGQPAAGSSLQQPATARPTSGLKAPRGSLQQPGAPNSGLKAPGESLLQRPTASKPTSGLKAPSKKSLQPPSATAAVPATKPSLKAPVTSLQMMRPGQLRGPAGRQPAPGLKGPLKATERHSKLKGPETRLPLTSHVNGVPLPQPAVKRAPSPVHRSLQTTPVKQEKNVQPKRLMSGLQNLQTPPRKSSDSSDASGTPASTKRRSFLPTPGRTFTGPRRSSSSVSSVNSVDSTGSPQLRGKSPAARRSLSSPMRTRPKIQYTPKDGGTQEPRRSAWSPIRRQKALCKEEEMIRCTKRTVPQYQ